MRTNQFSLDEKLHHVKITNDKELGLYFLFLVIIKSDSSKKKSILAQHW
jgi:hypothetical protein